MHHPLVYFLSEKLIEVHSIAQYPVYSPLPVLLSYRAGCIEDVTLLVCLYCVLRISVDGEVLTIQHTRNDPIASSNQSDRK